MDIDALSCPRCSTPMLVIAFITDPVDDQAPGLDENDQVPEDTDEQSDDVGTRSPRSPP